MEKTTIAKSCELHARIGWQGLTKNEYLDQGDYYLVTGVDFEKGHINFSGCHYVTKDRFDQDSHIQLRINDVLVTKDGTIGKVAIIDTSIDKPATLNSGVFVVRPKEPERLLPKYLMIVLLSNHFNQFIERIKVGCTIAHLNQEKFLGYCFPLPSVKKQEQIIQVFDRLFSLINKRKEELTKLDDLIKARFVEMFGDPKLNPYNFPVHQLSEFIEFLTSGSRGWAQYCVDNGAEWFITIKNVKDCHITTENMQPINAPDNAEAKRTRVQEGDLLISITADLGRTGVVTQEIADHGAYINQHLTCIRLNREVLEPLYVAYFMESAAGKEQFASKNQSAVKAGLNFNSINTLRLVVPPKAKQLEFLELVNQVDKSKIAVQKALNETQTLFESLMQKFFG